jgi:hypothetical protein
MEPLPFKPEDRIETFIDAPVTAEQWRWKKSPLIGDADFLPPGRYIVEEADPDRLFLAVANWDENGLVTFWSEKHHFLIEGEENVDALRKFLLDSRGPLEWRPSH